MIPSSYYATSCVPHTLRHCALHDPDQNTPHKIFPCVMRRSKWACSCKGSHKRPRETVHHLVSTRICDDVSMHEELLRDARKTNLYTTFDAVAVCADVSPSLAMRLGWSQVDPVDVWLFVRSFALNGWFARALHKLRHDMKRLYFSPCREDADWMVFHDDLPHAAAQFKLLFEWAHDDLIPLLATDSFASTPRRVALRVLRVLARLQRKDMEQTSAMLVHASPDRVGTRQLVLRLRRAMF